MFRRKFIDRLRKKYQSGGMYNQPQQYQEGGKYPHNMYNKKTGYKIVAEDAEAHKALSKDFDHNKMMGGGMYNQMQQYGMGGQQLPGGEMEPIPGSDAMQFNGQSHDQGGIMLDDQTEVEGGETMDQVTMAKNGGKRSDYFFSDHLKEGGVSYANMHKDILAEGGEQEKIDYLAQMQEKAAGRSPNKIQTAEYGGVKKYQTAGEYQKLQYDVEDAHFDKYGNTGSQSVNVDGELDNNEFGITFNPEFNPITLQKEVEVNRNTNNTPIVDTEDSDYIDEDIQADLARTTEEESAAQLTSQENTIISGDNQKNKTLLQKLKEKLSKGAIPREAYIAGVAQLLPAAYSLFNKQDDAEQASYTPGFTSPIVAERGKASRLERVNYNNERSTNASDMRGLNKFIETSGGGPANIINKMMAYSKKQKGDSKINAAETRANMQISNREAQLNQQMQLSNMQRAQQASITNAQMIRAEATRADQINLSNASARQRLKDDEAYNKFQAVSSAASGIAGIAGDVLSYKAQERLARSIGADGIYDRDKLRDELRKENPDMTEDEINSFITKFNKIKK